MENNNENIILDTTPQELTPEMQLLFKNHHIEMKRKERNKLLDQSDKYTISDFPITMENKMKILIYRQDLRDFDFNDFSLNFPIFPI
jgi:hypothetical protein